MSGSNSIISIELKVASKPSGTKKDAEVLYPVLPVAETSSSNKENNGDAIVPSAPALIEIVEEIQKKSPPVEQGKDVATKVPSAPTLDEIEKVDIPAETVITGLLESSVADARAPVSFCQPWSDDWREFISLLPGLILIFANGAYLHLIIRTMLTNNEASLWNFGAAKQNVTASNVTAVPASQSALIISEYDYWIYGAAAGNLFAVVAVTYFSKRFNYVSQSM